MKDLVAAIQLVLDEPERAADITDRQRRVAELFAPISSAW